MTRKKTNIRLIIMLLMAICFTVVGVASPILYASNAPADQYIEVHSFTSGDTSVDTEVHYLCFDRTIHQRASGTVFIELYLVSESGESFEVASSNSDRYFQEGRQTIYDEVQMPSTLEPGTYFFYRVYQMELANGQVTRSFEFTSDEFEVSANRSVASVESVPSAC